MGYVYVMINPSLNGLVKIGKTTKDPNERAKELSSATGVPTPYTVVYQREFYDCDKAEQLAHSILTERGYRVNENREFFSISIPEAIDLIINLPNDDISIQEAEYTSNEEDEDLGEIYYTMGEDYFHGYNNTFIDKDEALRYYKKSANLGCIKAYLAIGVFYRDIDTSTAIKYLKQGVEKGSLMCNVELGKIFMGKYSKYFNEYNARLAWHNFFEALDKMDSYYAKDFVDIILEFIFCTFLYDFKIDSFIENIIYQHRIELINKTNERLAVLNNDEEYINVVELYEQQVLPYLKELEEKILLSVADSNDLSANYYTVANNYYEGNNVDIDQDKALSYFQKSADLGYMKSYAKIGCIHISKDNPEEAVIAWNTFYNYVFDLLENDKDSLNKEINSIFDEFIEIFFRALHTNNANMLHPYYAYLAMYLGIVPYYSKLIEDIISTINNLQSRMDQISNELSYADDSESLYLEVDLLSIKWDFYEANFNREKFEKIHQYIKDTIAEIQQTGSSQAKFIRL